MICSGIKKEQSQRGTEADLVGITSMLVATTHQCALVRAVRIACLSHSMASWAKEVLGRVFSTKGSRATSETTASSSRTKTKKTLIADEEPPSHRRGSLSLANAAALLKTGSWNRTRVSTIDSHRRVQSQPVNSPPKIARLCHARSTTQGNDATSKLPEYVVSTTSLVDQDEEQDHESPAVTAHDVQRATRQALEQTNDAPFPLHDPTIEWEPPTWDDLWRNSTRSMRTHSSSRLSTFLRTPKGAANQSEVRPKADRRNRSVSRKSSFEDLRNHGQPKPDRSSSVRAPSLPEAAPARHMSIKRSSLQKELPSLPLHEASDLPPRYLQENAARNARIVQSLQDEGVLDLRDSEDTDTAVVWAPAVTHETQIIQPVQVVQRAVSREVHNHHFMHGVLPVVDLQVLPARHFCPDGHGGYVEISEDQIPGGKPDNFDQLIAEAVSKSTPRPRGGGVVKQKSTTSAAREDGSRGKGSSNLEREQWWMHYPSVTSATGLQKNAKQEASRPLDRTAEMTGERTNQHTFTYRTPGGLPSWTAIATEPPLQSNSATPKKSRRHP